MIKKINNSLALKVFIIITAILFSVSLILYGIVMTIIPVSYQNLTKSNDSTQISHLTSELEKATLDDGIPLIYNFCIRYGAIATLTGNGTEMSFGVNNIPESEDENPTQTALVSLNFMDTSANYLLSITFINNTVNQIMLTFTNLLPIIIGIILIISTVGAFFCSRFLSKPIIEISHISKKMATLDMTQRCHINRSDEIGILAYNLNTMAEKLDYTLSELTSTNEKLHGDIERKRQQEKQRVDFFRAVSHELKTPITILKGELEGMIYAVGDYKDRDTYLQHAMGTVIDMEKLLKEILSASRIAANDLAICISEINIGELIIDCCLKWQSVAEDKKMTFIYDIENPLLYHGDKGLFQKAFSNIIGNAVLHSSAGATVTVCLKDRVFQIENTGISITQTDIEQIYQPFYRVEKSHNRTIGGSGLGLYIVKTVFDRHGLKYDIQNTAKGVEFTVVF